MPIAPQVVYIVKGLARRRRRFVSQIALDNIYNLGQFGESLSNYHKNYADQLSIIWTDIISLKLQNYVNQLLFFSKFTNKKGVWVKKLCAI